MTKIKKNIYEQKAKKKSLSGLNSEPSVAETKHDFTKTLAYTGRDILFGGIGGALAGRIVGKSSFLLGIAVAGTGHFFGSAPAAMFGVGLMASGGYQTIAGSVNGVEKDGFEGVKERFMDFGTNLKRQLFLDKILPKKKVEEPKEEVTNGVEEVQYFKHPGSEDLSGGLDYTEANRLEEQINQSARDFEAKNGGERSGVNGDMNGLEGAEDRLY